MTPHVWIERRLITSVEDAEALPDDAMIFDRLGPDAERFVPSGNHWHCDGWPDTLAAAVRYARVGAAPYPVALVPLDAEEETLYAYAVRDDWAGGEKVRRLVTDWEMIGT